MEVCRHVPARHVPIANEFSLSGSVCKVEASDEDMDESHESYAADEEQAYYSYAAADEAADDAADEEQAYDDPYLDDVDAAAFV